VNHEELSGLYELYTLGVLEEPERAEIDQHLGANCPECQAGVKGALRLNALLATLPEGVEPSRQLRQRVMASVGVEPALSRFWKNAWALAAVALAMVLVVMAIDSHRRGQDSWLPRAAGDSRCLMRPDLRKRAGIDRK